VRVPVAVETRTAEDRIGKVGHRPENIAERLWNTIL
jgi:hypothetical protein